MFRVNAGFCPECGSVLPSVGVASYVVCYSCKKSLSTDVFKNVKSKYTINFNSIENMNIAKKNKNKTEESEGPIAEKVCKRCGHDQMSYAAMQLRSADEGQTVFYTCVKCKFTESENS